MATTKQSERARAFAERLEAAENGDHAARARVMGDAMLAIAAEVAEQPDDTSFVALRDRATVDLMWEIFVEDLDGLPFWLTLLDMSSRESFMETPFAMNVFPGPDAAAKKRQHALFLAAASVWSDRSKHGPRAEGGLGALDRAVLFLREVGVRSIPQGREAARDYVSAFATGRRRTTSERRRTTSERRRKTK